MKTIGYITATLVFGVIGAIWSGYVTCILWSWFIVPTFHAPQLSIAAAIGIGLVVNYMTAQRMPDTTHELGKSELQRWSETIGYMLMKPLLALGIGAVVKIWV